MKERPLKELTNLHAAESLMNAREAVPLKNGPAPAHKKSEQLSEKS